MRNLLCIVLGIAWAACATAGSCWLWHYSSVPGQPAATLRSWPEESHISRNHSTPTLVVFIHPHCPCTRATLGELARLMAACDGKLTARVLAIRPSGTSENWEKTDLWQTAAAIPGVTVSADPDGRETRRFGGFTSGQTLLYGADGHLLFSGGITDGRGHAGDNAGRSAICQLVLGTNAAGAMAPHTPVYGCPLLGECPVNKSQRGIPWQK